MWWANWSSYVLMGDLEGGQFLLLDDLVGGRFHIEQICIRQFFLLGDFSISLMADFTWSQLASLFMDM